MTEARKFKSKSNLAQKLAKPGGRTIADAVRLADCGVEAHRANGMLAVAATLSKLEDLCRICEAGSEQAVYDQSSALLDMAGFFETGPLYSAAYSLCEMADLMLGNGNWDWPSVEVHVRVLRLILVEGFTEGEVSTKLLDGLKALVARAR